MSPQTPWLKLTCVVALGGLPLGAAAARALLILSDHRALNARPLPAEVQSAVLEGLAPASPRSRAEVESFATAALATSPNGNDGELAWLYAGAFNAAAQFAGLPDHAHVMRSDATLWGLELGEMTWVSVPETYAITPLSVSPGLAVSGLGGDLSANVVWEP